MSTSRRRLLQHAGMVCGTAVASGEAAAASPEMTEIQAFLSVFPKRQTVRRFKPDPVPEEHLRQILDAARRGPTCMNQQPWKFLVIRDRG